MSPTFAAGRVGRACDGLLREMAIGYGMLGTPAMFEVDYVRNMRLWIMFMHQTSVLTSSTARAVA